MKNMSKLMIAVFAVFSISLTTGLTACGGKSPEPTPVDPKEDEQLKQFKAQCIEELNNHLDLLLYRDDDVVQIKSIIAEYTTKINNATTILEVDALFNEAVSKLDEVKTDEERRKEEIPTYETSTSTATSRYYSKLGYKPLYHDINYREPILVSKPIQDAPPYYYTDKLIDPYDTGHEQYEWEIAQWASKYNLISQEGDELSGHTVSTLGDYGLTKSISSKGKQIEGEEVLAKEVILDTATGAMQLKCNCSAEYDHPRTSNESWVHLLMQQNYDKDEIFHISSKESIIMESEFVVNECINHMGSAYNSGLHAAQVVWYLKITNKNEESEGYNRGIWFGLGVWDNRSAGSTTPEYIAHDAGTNTLIVCPASSETYKNRRGLTPKVGESAKISVDVIPVLREAFIVAKERGYLPGSNWDDLYITHTNLGFEMPGTFDIDVSYKSIGVYVK